jgi:hypothetical protein
MDGAPNFICANTLAGEVESVMDGASEGRGGMEDIPPFKAKDGLKPVGSTRVCERKARRCI